MKSSKAIILYFALSCIYSASMAQVYTGEIQIIEDAGGKLGVGLMPKGKLDVLIAGNSSAGRRFMTSGNSGVRLQRFGDGAGSSMTYGFLANDETTDWGGFGAYQGSAFYYYFIGPTYSNAVAVFTGDGKMGINTTSPSSSIEIKAVPGSNAEIKLKQPNEQATWGMVVGQNTSMDCYIAAPGRNLTVEPGWSNVLTLGTAQMNNHNGKVVMPGGNVGIGLTSPSQKLSVNGNASKSTAGDWVANSDARLKKNITPLNSEETLSKLLQLQGVTYEWDDDKTGLERPSGVQFGFTAQNIQQVYPTLVSEDDMGYLQSAYSTYDAMLVESIRALNEKIRKLEEENEKLRKRDLEIQSSLESIQKQLQQFAAGLSTSPIQNKEVPVPETKE